MQQVLFCLAAILVFAVFSLTRHEALASGERAEMKREVETAALEVAERWTARVRDTAFDEADLARAQMRLQGELDGLTPLASFGPTEEAFPGDFDDVDDFDRLDVPDSEQVGLGVSPFRVQISVRYADPATFGPAAGPTTAKEALVTVTEVLPPGATRPPVRVQMPVRVTPARQFLHS
jgi:hypothetical protein